MGRFNENYGGPTVEDIELTYKIEKVAPIKFTPKLIVKHEFEDFPIIAKKYFLRTRDWMHLYLKRYRFDPVATTQQEAAKPLVLNFFFLSLVILLVIKNLYTFSTAFILFLIYIFLEIRFVYFLFQKKGIVFALKSIPVSIVLYIIIEFGAFYGVISYFLTSRNSKD